MKRVTSNGNLDLHDRCTWKTNKRERLPFLKPLPPAIDIGTLDIDATNDVSDDLDLYGLSESDGGRRCDTGPYHGLTSARKCGNENGVELDLLLDPFEASPLAPLGIHYQPLPFIQERAVGCLAPFLTSPRSRKIVDHVFPVSTECLVARLSAFLTEVSEMCSTVEVSELTVVQGLRSLGWHLQKLRLNAPTSAFKTIQQHSFWLAIPPEGVLFTNIHNKAQVSVPQFVIDFHFVELFLVARPTTAFQRFLGRFRSDFVGTLAELQDAIRAFAAGAEKSLQEQEMAIPPWRKATFLESCFSRAIRPTEVLDEDISEEEASEAVASGSQSSSLIFDSPILIARLASLGFQPSTLLGSPRSVHLSVSTSSFDALRAQDGGAALFEKEPRPALSEDTSAMPICSGLSQLMGKWKGFGI